jgi:hypothetical protein
MEEPDSSVTFLHADDEGGFNQAALHGQHRLAQRRAAAGVGRFHGHGLGPAQPGEVSDECAEVVLIAQLPGQHVADVNRVDVMMVGIVHRRLNGVPRQVADGCLPVLAHVGLADAYD